MTSGLPQSLEHLALGDLGRLTQCFAFFSCKQLMSCCLNIMAQDGEMPNVSTFLSVSRLMTVLHVLLVEQISQHPNYWEILLE